MEKNETLLRYAVVENGIIMNALVFSDKETAVEFGCLPLSPYQEIGEQYMTPEDYEINQRKIREQELEKKVTEIVNTSTDT